MPDRADVERAILTSELRTVENAAGHPTVVFARFSLGSKQLGLSLSSENVIVALEDGSLSADGALRVGDKIVAVNGAPADRSYTETMIHGAAEVGAEVAFIATRVPPALEPPAAVVRADAVSTLDSSSGSERQSSISIGSAASAAGNLLSGVFKKLTPAEKEAERKLEEAPSEDAAAAWAAAVAEEAAGGAAAAEPAGEPSTPATEAVASDRRISADYVKVGVMGVGSGVMGKLGAMGKRFGTSSGKSRDRADSTGSAPDAAGALAAAEALAAANPFTKLGGRKSPANPFDADAAAAAPAVAAAAPLTAPPIGADAAGELFDALDQGRPRDAPPLSIADVAVALWPAADATPSEAGERARQVLEARGIALPRTVQ